MGDALCECCGEAKPVRMFFADGGEEVVDLCDECAEALKAGEP